MYWCSDSDIVYCGRLAGVRDPFRVGDCSTWLHARFAVCLHLFRLSDCIEQWSTCRGKKIKRWLDSEPSASVVGVTSFLSCPLYWSDVLSVLCAGRARGRSTVKMYDFFVSYCCRCIRIIQIIKSVSQSSNFTGIVGSTMLLVTIVGPLYCRAEIFEGRVACCPLVTFTSPR